MEKRLFIFLIVIILLLSMIFITSFSTLFKLSDLSKNESKIISKINDLSKNESKIILNESLCGNEICEKDEDISCSDCKKLEDCEILRKDILEETDKARKCDKDSDCIYDTNFLSCLNVCGMVRNKGFNINILKELIKKYDKECLDGGCPAYGCQDNYEVECKDSKCRVKISSSL